MQDLSGNNEEACVIVLYMYHVTKIQDEIKGEHSILFPLYLAYFVILVECTVGRLSDKYACILIYYSTNCQHYPNMVMMLSISVIRR